MHGVRDAHDRLRLQGNSTPDRWRDEVGYSGVYPASSMQEAPHDAQTQGEALWGQGDRGAVGYNDHGDSEVHVDRPKKEKR